MGTIKHTSAPWQVTKQATENGSFFRVKGETVKVCNVVTRDYETALKNAKLIAAAPELLEACKELLDLLRFHGYQHSTEIYDAQAIIKKATE